MDVACSYFDQDYFQFKSDKTDASDTDGDGLIISGMQNGSNLVLTIVDGDTTFSSAGISDWKKDAGAAAGRGVLYGDDGSGPFEVEFEIHCE